MAYYTEEKQGAHAGSRSPYKGEYRHFSSRYKVPSGPVPTEGFKTVKKRHSVPKKLRAR